MYPRVKACWFSELFCVYQEYAKDEETLKAVYQSVNAVVGILRSSNEDLPSRPGISTSFAACVLFLTVRILGTGVTEMAQ